MPGENRSYPTTRVVASYSNESANSTQNSQPSGSPFRSAEAFDAYCTQVQARLAEHAEKRQLFLSEAGDRLERLYQAARGVDDEALAREIGQHRTAVQELIEALNHAPLAQEPLPPQRPESPRPAFWKTSRSLDSAAHSLPAEPMSLPLRSHPSESSLPTGVSSNGMPDQAVVAVQRPRIPSRPLPEIVADALRLQTELQDWNLRYPLLTAEGDLNAPNCLRLRALASRHRRLETEAGDSDIPEIIELGNEIVALLDQADDQEYTVALDYELDPRPSAFQWGEMADRYLEMARAQEAYEWWVSHRAELSVAEAQPLVEAIAAIQQRFNRLLFRVGSRDPFQQQLFDELRHWAREAQCYLHSLRPKVPIQELIERGSGLEAAFEQAKLALNSYSLRVEAAEAVIALVQEPQFGSRPKEDEERLQKALLLCSSQRIPSSDRRMREALAPWYAFLEGDERFREWAREAQQEWMRRYEMGTFPEPPIYADEALGRSEAEIAKLQPHLSGKRCLILGGALTDRNLDSIRQALEPTWLAWNSALPSDTLSRFDRDLKEAEVVILMTAYSRKEWQNVADFCERQGALFLTTSGCSDMSSLLKDLCESLPTG